jgi:hypothetical protein
MNSKLLTLLLLLFVSHVNALASLRAGVAVRTVNPDPLLPVSGGVGPSHPVTRREGDLTVRALVLEQEGTLVAIVSADFLGFPAMLGDRVRAAHAQRPGLLWFPGRRRRHGAGRQICGASVRQDGRGDPRSPYQPSAGAA